MMLQLTLMSRLARGAWIETDTTLYRSMAVKRRASQGARGLKLLILGKVIAIAPGRASQGARGLKLNRAGVVPRPQRRASQGARGLKLNRAGVVPRPQHVAPRKGR